MIVILAVVGAVLGGRAWRQQAWRAELPVRPADTGRPAVLMQLLDEADRRARATPSVDAVAELGRLYHANGFIAEAEACWRRLSLRQPEEPRWHYYLADLRRAEGDDDTAALLWRKTLTLAPDYSPALLHLANLQFKAGDFAAAETCYRRRLALVPRDPYARLGLIRLALQHVQTEEARSLLEALIKDEPNFSSAHNLYAGLLDAAGDQAGARWHRWLGAETLRYAEPEDPWIDELQSRCYDYQRLCVLGSIESMREHRDRAWELYERALGIAPEVLDAYQLLSALYLAQGQPAAVRDLLERAKSRVTTAQPVALFTLLARAYRMLDQPVAAERVARDGLAQIGPGAELLESLGLALADLQRHEEAVAAYEAALARSPNDASINYNLAVSLFALRRLDDVLAALDRSLTLQPTFAPTLVLRGRIEMAAGHWTEAEGYLRPVFESHPENTEARQALAEWHRHMADAAEAKRDATAFERHCVDGLTIEPENADLHVRLAAFYLARSRAVDAIASATVYRRLRPDDPRGGLLLGEAHAASGHAGEAREYLTEGLRLAEQQGQPGIADACRAALRRLP